MDNATHAMYAGDRETMCGRVIRSLHETERATTTVDDVDCPRCLEAIASALNDELPSGEECGCGCSNPYCQV